MADRVAAIGEFYARSVTFDVNAYLARSNSSETLLDAGARKAVIGQGRVVTKFPQVKRRNRDVVHNEATKWVLSGYNIVRYVLGTWDIHYSYSTPSTAEVNASKLQRALARCPPPDSIMAGVGEGLRELIAGFALGQAGESPLIALFGSRDTSGIILTSICEGIGIALCEADTFVG